MLVDFEQPRALWSKVWNDQQRDAYVHNVAGHFKNVKSAEYMAMLKRKRQRTREDPSRRTAFRLRGKEVNLREVSRFERRAIKKGSIGRHDSLSDVGKCLPGSAPLRTFRSQSTEDVPDLECYTPPPESDPAGSSRRYSSHEDDDDSAE